MNHRIVSKEQWLFERKKLLEKEKEFTRLRDELTKQRQKLPWLKIEKSYQFQTNSGNLSLVDLFEDKSQVLIYHFMLGPDWQNPCKSCSFWADNFENLSVHLAARDVKLYLVSRAPIEKINSINQKMGWTTPWISSYQSDFNYDFQASFKDDEMQSNQVFYNFKHQPFPVSEAPGLSCFIRQDRLVYHTYSTYARGLDMLNLAYHLLDVAPKGRNEDDLPFSMAWLNLRNDY